MHCERCVSTSMSAGDSSAGHSTCLLIHGFFGAIQTDVTATCSTVLKHLVDSDARCGSLTMDMVEKGVQRGTDCGWLVPEDDGAFHLKDPVQTPERVQA